MPRVVTTTIIVEILNRPWNRIMLKERNRPAGDVRKRLLLGKLLPRWLYKVLPGNVQMQPDGLEQGDCRFCNEIILVW